MLEKRKIQIEILKMAAVLLVGGAVVFFSQGEIPLRGTSSFLLFPAGNQIVLAADEEGMTEEEKKEQEEKEEEAEEKIDDIKDEIKDIEKDKQKDVQRKLQISGEIGSINSNISVIKNEIGKSEEEIDRVESEIEKSEKELAQKKKLLAETIRKINQVDIEMRLILMSEEGNYGTYFQMVDGLESFEEKVYQLMSEIKQEKDRQEGQREEQEKVLEMKDDQKKSLEHEKGRKNATLNETQRGINEKDLEIGDLQAKLSKLKRELSSLLGKGYDADDIKDAARFASKVTGVRKDFIMGMLVVESDLGRYTGGCNYKESRMSSYRKDLFKQICKELDYNYKKQKVSCPPSGYSGTGGAMGVAQFMSDTWMGYKNSIADATGHDPPDPWSLTDGVTAMALKLAKVSGVTSHKKSAECKAAKLYLSGTTSSKYDWYCDKVFYWADHYKKLL